MRIESLIGEKQFTILLGKNGAGKSSLLRSMDERAELNTRYITPERGGVLKYEPGVDSNIAQHLGWLENTRRKNRFESFRQQSAALFRNLELLYLREIEKDRVKRADPSITFDSIINRINDYLPAIKLVRSDRGFSFENLAGTRIDEDSISSGESEFIAQAIEVLVFSRSDGDGKILLLDEPDVHLHPDLQARFAQFIEHTAVECDMKIVVATHSTAILGGFSDGASLQVIPVSRRGQEQFEAFERKKVSDVLLPIFGAHPLSSTFNRLPILLVEGEDDRRLVEQVVRSSAGRVKLNPCVVGTVVEMGSWEVWLERFLPVLYDDPKAFSLRDLDDALECEINDLDVVKRARLNCYAAENLLLTDEFLVAANSDHSQLLEGLRKWRDAYPDHVSGFHVQSLIDNFGNRRILKIKEVKNILLAVLGISKPWEVQLGQVLARQDWFYGEGDRSLNFYLGPKAAALFMGVGP